MPLSYWYDQECGRARSCCKNEETGETWRGYYPWQIPPWFCFCSKMVPFVSFNDQENLFGRKSCPSLNFQGKANSVPIELPWSDFFKSLLLGHGTIVSSFYTDDILSLFERKDYQCNSEKLFWNTKNNNRKFEFPNQPSSETKCLSCCTRKYVRKPSRILESSSLTILEFPGYTGNVC